MRRRRRSCAGLSIAVGLLLSGCGQSDSGASDISRLRQTVAAAEAKTLAVQSVRVDVSWPDQADTTHGNFVAYWQAPNRVRAENDAGPINITVANKIYAANPDEPDRYELMVVPGTPSDVAKISNFPVVSLGGIASRASSLAYDGTNYVATVPVGEKSFTATLRISDGFIVWLRVVTPDNDNTYELSEFNTAPAVEEPPSDKVRTVPNPPSCSETNTRPTTTIGIVEFCMVDATTR